jgi:hypothetical protein
LKRMSKILGSSTLALDTLQFTIHLKELGRGQQLTRLRASWRLSDSGGRKCGHSGAASVSSCLLCSVSCSMSINRNATDGNFKTIRKVNHTISTGTAPSLTYTAGTSRRPGGVRMWLGMWLAMVSVAFAFGLQASVGLSSL